MSCAAPDDEGAAYIEQVVRTATGGLGARPRLPRGRWHIQRPGRAGGPPRAGPGPRRRHRQDPPRPAVERLLREGARRPLLAVLRARSLRRPLRARRHRLPRRLRALDRAPQPRVLPRPARRRARSTSPRSCRARTRSTTRPRSTTSCAPGRCAGWASCFEYPRRRRRGRRGDRCPARRGSRPRRPAGGDPPDDAHGAARLHRGRQLRHLDAAAAPREARRASRSARWPRRGRCRRSTPSASSGSRRTTTDADDVLADPCDRRGLRRDPAPLPRRLRLPRPRARQGRVRREAAGPHPGGGRRHPRRRRAHRERPDHGGVQPALRPAVRRAARALRRGGHPGQRAVPGQRRPDGGRQLVPRRAARGVAVPRRGRPLHRHAQLRGSVTTPSRCSAVGPPAGPTCRSRCASPTARWERSPTSTGGDPRGSQGDPRRLRRRPERPAGQLRPGHGVDPRRPRHQAVAHRPGQGPAAPSSTPSSRRSGSVRRCRSASTRSSRPPARPSRWARASPRAGRWPRESAASWYAQRLRRMSPEEVIARVGDQLRQVRWAERQVRPGDAWLPAGALLPRPALASPVASAARAQLAPAAARRLVDAADRLLAGDWEVLGTPRPDVVDPDWFRDPVTGTRAPDTALAFRVDHRDETVTGNVKSVWELSRHHHLTVLAAAYWLTEDDPLRRGGGGPAALVVGREPVPVRHPLDQRDRARRAPDELGLDPPAARRLAGGRRPLRRQPPGPRAAALAPGVPGGVPQPRVVREQPRHRRVGRPAHGRLRPAVVRRERRLATRRDPRPGARARRQHLPERHQPRARHRLPPLRHRARPRRPRGGRGRGPPALRRDPRAAHPLPRRRRRAARHRRARPAPG